MQSSLSCPPRTILIQQATAPSVANSSWNDASSLRTSGDGGSGSLASRSGTPPTAKSGTVFEPDAFSDTTSLPADAEDYPNIYGRSFPNPKYGWSWCAIDEKFLTTSDNDLDFHCLQQNFRLFRAPISEPTCVLDLKAGSGYWVDKFALSYESVDVLGIDIAAVQSATEPNCRFEFDNINLEWNREWESFDLIHGQKLLGNVNDWLRLFRNAFKCLTAGGFVNLRDRPFSYTSKGGAIDSWNWVSQQARELGDEVGCSFVLTPDTYKDYMTEAGFVYICEEWDTMSATKCLDSILDEVECMLFRKWYTEDVDPEEAKTRIVEWRGRLVSEASSVNIKCVTVWGRKPFEGKLTSALDGPDNDVDGSADTIRDEDRPSATAERVYDDVPLNIRDAKRACTAAWLASLDEGHEEIGLQSCVAGQFGLRDVKRLKQE